MLGFNLEWIIAMVIIGLVMRIVKGTIKFVFKIALAAIAIYWLASTFGLI